MSFYLQLYVEKRPLPQVAVLFAPQGDLLREHSLDIYGWQAPLIVFFHERTIVGFTHAGFRPEKHAHGLLYAWHNTRRPTLSSLAAEIQ